ncbi:MAG: hypothetical protein QOJ00_65 [Actinomycetota bacterium]
MNEFSVLGLRALVESTAADFEPGVLGLSTVEAAVSHWGAIERIACAAKLRAAARAEDLGLDADAAVADASGVTSGQARRQTKLRKKLADKARTRDALDKGDLSPTQADAIADAVDANPDAEESLLDVAAAGSTSQLLSECERVRRDALDAAGGLAARQRAARSLRHWKNALGNVCGNFEFEPLFGAKFVAELERRADRMFRDQARGGGTVDTQPQRMADALQHIVTGGEAASTGVRRGPRTNVFLLADKAAVDRGHLKPGEKCETADGTPVPMQAVDEALADPDTVVRAVVCDETDVTSIITYTRYWPKRVEDALIARGLVCEVPGCGRTRGLQKDHHHDFGKGGPTSAANGGWLCAPHHKLKTRRLYDLQVDADGVKRWQPTRRSASSLGQRKAG